MKPSIFAADSSSKKPFSLVVLGDASVPMAFKDHPRDSGTHHPKGLQMTVFCHVLSSRK